MYVEERDRQNHCKQHLYNTTSNYVPNNLDNNFDEVKDNTYPAGTVLHTPDSAVGHLLLAWIKQAQESLLPCKLTAPVSHLLLQCLLLKHIAPAPGLHTPVPRQSVLSRGAVPCISSLEQVNQVLVLQAHLVAVYRQLNLFFKRHRLFIQQLLEIQDQVHALGNQLD
jgi:hypothetical protein